MTTDELRPRLEKLLMCEITIVQHIQPRIGVATGIKKHIVIIRYPTDSNLWRLVVLENARTHDLIPDTLRSEKVINEESETYNLYEKLAEKMNEEYPDDYMRFQKIREGEGLTISQFVMMLIKIGLDHKEDEVSIHRHRD
jgi:hypothetical protein